MQWAPYAALAGLSLEVRVATGSGRTRASFDEDLLFTHRGLSGPAILQISSHWRPGEPIVLDLYCGGGGITLSIADLARKAVGVDT